MDHFEVTDLTNYRKRRDDTLFIRDNDLIDVIAPGFRAKLDLVNLSSLAFQELGLRLRYPENLYGPHTVSCNSVDVRVEHLFNAIKARDSKLIWCLRGGYGSIHLLPYLDKFDPGPQRKLMIGYSDVTSLMIYFVQKWGWRAIHGPLVDGMTDMNVPLAIRQLVMQVLRGEKDEVAYPAKRLPGVKAPSEDIVGEVLGGNIMVAGSTLGTPYQLEGRGRILFFEEVAERAYRIDRVLVQMTQAGVFKGVKAVVFGVFKDCQEPDGENKIPALLADFARAADFPVFCDLPVGHGRQQNPLPMGYEGKISTDGWLSVSLRP